MLIVDAQVHIWGAETPERPWSTLLNGHPPQKPYPITAEMALAGMDEAGVDRVVLVPPSWEGDRNDVALEAARLHPDRFAVTGRITLDDPAARDLMPGWMDTPGMLGIRLSFLAPLHRRWLVDGTADWFWPAAERHGVPVTVLPPGNVAELGRIAEAHPGLRLVFDHMALPPELKGPEAFTEQPDLLALARLPNVAVKVSALPIHSVEPYPFADVVPHLRSVYDAFGPERMFWGSDWSRLPCPWSQAVTLFTEEVDFLSGTELEMVMGGALLDWLGWPEHAPA